MENLVRKTYDFVCGAVGKVIYDTGRLAGIIKEEDRLGGADSQDRRKTSVRRYYDDFPDIYE